MEDSLDTYSIFHFDNVEALIRLMGMGRSSETRDGKGRTILIAAAISGADRCVEFLCGGRSDLEAFDLEAMTALQHAARDGHLACLDALIKGGACLDDAPYSPRRERGVGSAPLLLAIIGANHSCVGSLARAGADLSVHDEHGRGPARLCAAYQVAESLEILIKAGVELDVGDEHAAHAANHGKGETYRMIKAERERREIFVAAGAFSLPAGAKLRV